MIILAYIVGLGLPTLNGMLLLNIFQKRARVLDRWEHIAVGFTLGLTLTMLLTFSAHVYAGLPLTLIGFLGVQILTLIILLIANRFPLSANRLPITDNQVSPSSVPRWLNITLWILVASVILKTLFASTVFLFLTPTFLDDTLDNWNLRAKVYYIDQALTLALPGEPAEVSVKGISSYPPAVPLAKTWLATLNGSWSDSVANGIHIFWYAAVLIFLARTLRRLVGPGWDLAGVYLLGSMPLYTMHGTNTYADLFLSLHVLIAVVFPLRAMLSHDRDTRMTLLRIGALAAGIIPFTKNEGLLLYLPPLILLIGLGLLIAWKKQQMTIRDIAEVIAWYAGCLIVLSLPWLAFKWSNGLTFGNAKPFTSLGFAWQDGIWLALVINAFFEGNWLLLFPVFILLLIWRGRSAFGMWLPLTCYVLIVYLGQMFLYLFTGLSAEARMQTGLGRGGVQLMPVMMLLVMLLLASGKELLRQSAEAAFGWVGVKRNMFRTKTESGMLAP